MVDYWQNRLEHALNNSRNAPTLAIREAHLRTAVLYRSLMGLTATPRAHGETTVWVH